MARMCGRRVSLPVAMLVAFGVTVLAGCSNGPSDVPTTSEPTALPSVTMTSVPSATSSPIDLTIPLAAPTRVTVTALGIDAEVEEFTDAQVAAAGGWVDPLHRDVVAWWSGGGTPGNPADNTVYLYGHVSAQPAVFNALADATVGQVIEVTTSAGILVYRVTDVLPPILKSELPDIPAVAAAMPGRLVLIGCFREPNQGTRPTTKNTVVIAQQIAGY